MNKDLKFICGKCGLIWHSKDYPEGSDEHDGYNCPKCKSDDISSPNE